VNTADILLLTALAEIVVALLWFQIKGCTKVDPPLSREERTRLRLERAVEEHSKTQRFRNARGLK